MNQINPVIADPVPVSGSLCIALDDLIRHQRFGAALPECYGDTTGALTWAHYERTSDPKQQYNFHSEVSAIDLNGADIARLIACDPDLDTSRLIICENGNGPRKSMLAKPIKLVKFFEQAGMHVELYALKEHSAEFRTEGEKVIEEELPETDRISLDSDFSRDVPDISTDRTKNVNRPRIVMEFGSSRGNIPTGPETADNDFARQAYEELQARFAADYENCQEGGILIMGSDANQQPSAKIAYDTRAHAKFSENIFHRGRREGALSSEFDPQLLYYEPVLTNGYKIAGHGFSVVKHDLVAANDQDFGILQATGHFRQASIRENDHFTISHSIKWPPEIMIMAAESRGFKCLGVYWGEDGNVPVYVFKAMPKSMLAANQNLGDPTSRAATPI